MPDFVLLKVAHGQDTTSQNGPKFLFLKPSVLVITFSDFLAEEAIGIVPESIYFINIGAEMVDRFAFDS